MQNNYYLKINNYEIEIIPKRIKNFNLRIKKDLTIVASVPFFSKEKEVKQFLESKINWIDKHYHKLKNRIQRLDYDNEIVYIFGKKFSFKNLDFKSSLEKYLNETLLEYLNTERVKFDKILLEYKKPFPSLKVKKLKSKWGYCQPSKNLIVINNTLVHYEKEAINYVLLHEYMHLLVPNHSSEFYELIKKYNPFYKKDEALLKI